MCHVVYWKLTFIDSYHPRFRQLTWLWLQQDPISRQWPTINRSGWWWCTGNSIIHKLHIVYTLKTGNKCVESNDDNIIINLTCVFFNLFSLSRFPRHWKSLTSRSDHPVFWRRNFPTLLSSPLLSSHFTHNHMQVALLQIIKYIYNILCLRSMLFLV